MGSVILCFFHLCLKLNKMFASSKTCSEWHASTHFSSSTYDSGNIKHTSPWCLLQQTHRSPISGDCRVRTHRGTHLKKMCHFELIVNNKLYPWNISLQSSYYIQSFIDTLELTQYSRRRFNFTTIATDIINTRTMTQINLLTIFEFIQAHSHYGNPCLWICLHHWSLNLLWTPHWTIVALRNSLHDPSSIITYSALLFSNFLFIHLRSYLQSYNIPRSTSTSLHPVIIIHLSSYYIKIVSNIEYHKDCGAVRGETPKDCQSAPDAGCLVNSLAYT